MPNPALNEQVFKKVGQAEQADRTGWAAPGGDGGGTTWMPPIDDGPVSPYRRATMTVDGVVTASGVLLVILVASGVFGWNAVESDPTGVRIPGWIFVPLLAAFGLAIATVMRPAWARVTGPLYAVTQGVALGAISRAYEYQFDGIVVQAIGLTALTVGAMLLAFATRLIRVTERMRSIVTVATLAIAAFYGVSLLLSLFSVNMPFIWDAGPFGIAFSLFVVGLAVFNLLLDFDLAEKGAQQGLPKYMEWYCAFGLMVTVVWLYLELLRLLAKLRN